MLANNKVFYSVLFFIMSLATIFWCIELDRKADEAALREYVATCKQWHTEEQCVKVWKQGRSI